MAAETAQHTARSPHAGAAPCFLCALDAQPCAIHSLEGAPVRIAGHDTRRGQLAVRLAGTTRGDVTILPPDHTRPLLRDLAALSEEQRRALRLRAYHLGPIGAEDAAAETERETAGPLRAGPAGALVLEPDLLLNITDINNAEYCARQYPLRRMIPSPPTEATLRGTIIHQTFKELLKAGAPGDPAPHLARALRAAAPDLALRQVSASAMRDAITPHLDALTRWYAQARESLWGGETGIRAETFRLAPEVGLKGRLDILRTSAEGEAFIELKTGEVRAELPRRQHRWQVHGYQTLLAVRHPERRQRAGATLLYSGTPGQAEGYGIPFSLRELHRVLDLRNRLAVIHATGAVPPPPGPRKCARCALRVECARASALLGWEPPTLEDAPPPVAPSDAAWFATEYARLRLEARAT
ncbi:MAG TPA: PD-(D/E)XK nuclease family protein, partial [Ktedonobacterales bacterium]